MAFKNQVPKSILFYRALGVAAIAFGVMTLKEGGAVLFIDGASRAAAGHYVPFVLIFNFAAGFFYVLSGIGILVQKRWAHPLALMLALSSGLVFGFLVIHVLRDQAFEMRTVFAMILRTVFWLFTAIVLHNTKAFQRADGMKVMS